ncbi:MAG: ribonuclease HII [Alphaproteobacteria bacterium]|nr:ribonuclease HII [Alphaproteobacteria bacterium]
MPDFSHEIQCGRDSGKVICGVDEVGRGPLAGPVVAAAAIIPHDFPPALLAQIRDSKKMTEAARESLFAPLTALCPHAIEESSVEEIDRFNILQASLLAMKRAVLRLGAADAALIDGNRAPVLPCAARTIIKGDDMSYSIAAASIIAKVYRDRLMKKLAEDFPVYGWERNAGYGTREHLDAVSRHGITQWHRLSFAPIRAAQEKMAHAS